MPIYIGNLSYEVSEQDVREVFSEYGSVKQIYLPTDRETGRMRGFGFVHMESLPEEEAAIADLDGAEWCGRTLKVNKAKPREERQRGGGGGRNGGSYGGYRGGRN